jgi:hypothetical protein
MTRLCFGVPHEEVLENATYRRFTDVVARFLQEAFKVHPSEMVPKLAELPSGRTWLTRTTEMIEELLGITAELFYSHKKRYESGVSP